jgi:hypothetical protein
MQPANLDLTIYKGSTFVKTLQWKTGTPAVAVDLTGCTARMQVRKSPCDTVVLETLTTENGKIVITDATDGKIQIKISAETSTAYTFVSGVYDLEIVFSDNTVTRIIEGNFMAMPEVTR